MKTKTMLVQFDDDGSAEITVLTDDGLYGWKRSADKGFWLTQPRGMSTKAGSWLDGIIDTASEAHDVSRKALRRKKK